MENDLIKKYFEEVKNSFEGMDIERIKILADKIKEVKAREDTVFIIGNGGSASTASHMACDLMKNSIEDYNSSEDRLRAISLTDNLATISAYGNDLSYDEIFSQQLKSLMNDKDLLIVISGSGNSKNIVKAVEISKQIGAYVFGLLGSNGGIVAPLCDDSIIVPSKNYGVIEDLHMMIGHLLAAELKGENNLIS
ncbi:MAG: SIS domain-containing protein [Nanoarchaeota archaeon]|nr:SIS domain-containing protein [Nanoarchaeota archaeon]